MIIRKEEFINEIHERPIMYDYKTKYSALFNKKNGYIFDKDFLLEDIRCFVESYPQ
jgi:hypothetical protein